MCPIIPYVLGTPFCSPKMSKICQDFPCLAKCCLAFFGGRCQIPRLGVSCSSGAAFRAWVLFWPFLGAMPNPSLGCFLLVLTKWMVMESVYLELFALLHPFHPLRAMFLSQNVFKISPLAKFWGAMPNPSLGCFLLVRCCLSCLGSFVAFFGGDAKSKWMVMGSVICVSCCFLY